MKKKMTGEPIGWVVKWRTGRRCNYLINTPNIRTQRRLAIKAFAGTGYDYKFMLRRNLAKCVRVYVDGGE